MTDSFSNALVKLTLAYVVVLATVCLFFSGFIYQLTSREIEQTSRRQVIGFRNQMGGNFVVDDRLSEEIRSREASEARSRLKARLLLANIAVIGTGSVLAYVFAKKTLEPIEENILAQERFTSDASHELRTPLASMRSEIEVALRDSSLDLQEAKSLLVSNLEEVNAMHTMTESLLQLARSKELGGKQNVDVSLAIKELVHKYESSAKENKITLHARLKPMKLSVNKDALIQTLGILIDNAIRYAGEGSKVEIKARVYRGQCSVAVSDNGSGIDTALLDRIFDRFTRADESRTHQKAYGHGLGLSIAKQLVDAMGGTITVTSTKGKGTTFRIIIPAGVESIG